MISEKRYPIGTNSPERSSLSARRRISLLIITNVIFAAIAALSLIAAHQARQENESLHTTIREAELRADAERETAESAIRFMKELLSAQDEETAQAATDRARAILNDADKEPGEQPEN